MRVPLLLFISLLVAVGLFPLKSFGEDAPSISLATHNQKLRQPDVDVQAIERIRKIILNQDDDARALANLVQLTRKLPAPASSQLYYDLASEYLRRGKYGQAANMLQQLLNQYSDQTIASKALLKLVRLYSSREVSHTEGISKTGGHSQQEQQGFAKYALHLAGSALKNKSSLGNDPALIFQRAVAARLGGHSQAALGRLTRLKHKPQAGTWQTYALVEKWLQSNRKDDPPLPVVVCRRYDQHPHLDGVLDDSLWLKNKPVQFAYNDAFLYLAVSYPKLASLSYETDTRPRSYDADLTGHDHVHLRLDTDRDYATCYELAVDHRGWTNDRCWLDASWNLKWFLAAGGDDSHWTLEAAIPLGALTIEPPRSGEAWAISLNRVLPASHDLASPGTEAPSPDTQDFSLLLFE